MAYFAKLDDDGTVLAVYAVHDNELLDKNGKESEEKGIAFLTAWSGGHTNWKQTSYNTRRNQHSRGKQPFRKNYAGIGYKFRNDIDGFVPPKPFQSWQLNADAGDWDAPVPMPQDGKRYAWDEDALAWVEVAV